MHEDVRSHSMRGVERTGSVVLHDSSTPGIPLGAARKVRDDN